MFSALVSLLTNRAARSDTAMTGEISLRGLHAAGRRHQVEGCPARAGLATVILPARNREDYEEVPKAARNALRLLWAERFEDVIEAALDSVSEPSPAVAA